MGDVLPMLKGEDLETCKVKNISVECFETSLDEAQKWASSVGYQESDIDEIVKSVRAKRIGKHDSPGRSKND